MSQLTTDDGRLQQMKPAVDCFGSYTTSSQAASLARRYISCVFEKQYAEPGA